jgi:hypothetical protein
MVLSAPRLRYDSNVFSNYFPEVTMTRVAGAVVVHTERRGRGMSRRFMAPIQVWTCRGRPTGFSWEGRTYTVRWVVEHWVALRRSWRPEEGATLPRREYWRVQAGSEHGQGVYELSFDTADERWYLVRVWD